MPVNRFTILVSYLPFLYLSLGAAAIGLSALTAVAKLVLAALCVYLVPPLACRMLLAVFGRPQGRDLQVTDRAYRVWWIAAQLQIPFARLPFLEELLRLIPGAYGTWLNLWGSRVSLRVYWSPGVVVVDRYLLRIESDVLMGAYCAVSGHSFDRLADGSFRFLVAPTTIERGAVIGGRCGIGPGCIVGAGEQLPNGRVLSTFREWRQGRVQHRAGEA
jgi:hypothetical protein